MTRQNTEDERWMRRALALAAHGQGRVEPNPLVGAVIVRDSEMLSEGFHAHFGGPHAEAAAIRRAGEACRGATLYVTLSPCTGAAKKTPPCCDTVIAAGFRRVVIGTADPTQEIVVTRLQDAGIEVLTGVLEPECRRLIGPFLTLRLKGRPYVIAKWAMTADGRIATATGDSKWISSEASRQLVHRWRSEVDAVLVGAGTVRRDDPMLTCRVEGGRNPRRVLLDAQASVSLSSQLVRSASDAPVIVACLDTAPESARGQLAAAGCTTWPLTGRAGHVDLQALLKRAGSEQWTNLMVEGGAEVFGSFFEQCLVDEVRAFIAPKVAGGAKSPGLVGGAGVNVMTAAQGLNDARWTQVGEDMLLRGFLAAPE